MFIFVYGAVDVMHSLWRSQFCFAHIYENRLWALNVEYVAQTGVDFTYELVLC